MKRTRLIFENMQQLVGGEGIAIVLLTDEAKRRVLTVICDEAMQQQMLLRLQNKPLCRNLLPEVLLQLLPSTYEMMVFGLYDGQYQVALMDEDGNAVRLRMSDAVLLTLMSDVPLYIEDELMERQSVPYDKEATGIAVPINTMDLKRLKMVLRKAVDEENYELASQLRDEINRRHLQKPQ